MNEGGGPTDWQWPNFPLGLTLAAVLVAAVSGQPAAPAFGAAASVVDLKFLRFPWHPRLGTSNPKTTREINKLASVASNPKFAQSVAQAFANFGFATLAPYLANPHGAG